MTFSPSKPNSGPSPKLDAPQVKSDFSLWASIFAINHTAITGTTLNSGDHEAVVIPVQASDLGVTEDLVALFCKNATSNNGTQPQLFSQIPKFLPTKEDTTNAQNKGVQLTYQTVNTSGPQYQSFLPGGYFIVFGKTTFSAQFSKQITLSPAPSSLLSVVANSQVVDYNCSVTIDSTNKFTIYSAKSGSPPAPSGDYSWVAIGKV